ncbi:hypothetical protein MA16_Dca018117 [Dendrobium catenatum]|uniref:RST domain-containing protein n=1 Tax=Dendrobium catenatum TaxID=906689 RepID=A0A2I0WHA6_9ASPA|nr:hypothetical protein MA16_Dca018117 [Dendrobium catenatum]
MDPSRIKLFELDEMDEIMNGCVGAGAFAEALHKDIEGIDSTNLAASITNRNAGVLTLDDSSTTLKNNLQFTKHLTQLEQVKIFSSRYQNQHIDSQLQCDHRLLQHGNTHCEWQKGHSDNFSRQNVDNNPSQDIHQHSKIPKNSLELNMLVPQLQPLLDKDRSMLLRDLYIKLLNNEISKENYLKVCNKVVADRMIRREAAVHQAQMQNPVQSQSQSLYLIRGTSIKFPPKKRPIGKKKTLETSGNSQPQASKKQKTSGAFLDQSIEQLNDVTAVSGVNLRAEGEQLLVSRTEGTQASEAIQRVVQEEEETSILQKGPLLKKLTQIISRCGLGGISKDVEYCLSMCVEERLRSFIGKLIRLSKQRLDIENKRRKLVVTSDIQHQILSMNQKAKKDGRKNKLRNQKSFVS